MRLFALLVGMLAIAIPGVALAARGQDAALERRAALEREILRELNRVRASRGLEELRPARGLTEAAAAHSAAMLLRGFFGHSSPDGQLFHERIRRTYPSRGWSTWSVGETLYASADETNGREVVAAWLRSPSHREILLLPGWKEIGIAALWSPAAGGAFGGSATLVVTASFGLREGRQPLAARARPW